MLQFSDIEGLAVWAQIVATHVVGAQAILYLLLLQDVRGRSWLDLVQVRLRLGEEGMMERFGRVVCLVHDCLDLMHGRVSLLAADRFGLLLLVEPFGLLHLPRRGYAVDVLQPVCAAASWNLVAHF